eukprot:scaffold34606_cov192-Amphora_coffeaeformis.AAC.2
MGTKSTAPEPGSDIRSDWYGTTKWLGESLCADVSMWLAQAPRGIVTTTTSNAVVMPSRLETDKKQITYHPFSL